MPDAAATGHAHCSSCPLVLDCDALCWLSSRHVGGLLLLAVRRAPGMLTVVCCTGAAFAGLGFAADEPKYAEDDAFSAYRKSRSGAYREFMGRAAVAASGPGPTR